MNINTMQHEIYQRRFNQWELWATMGRQFASHYPWILACCIGVGLFSMLTLLSYPSLFQVKIKAVKIMSSQMAILGLKVLGLMLLELARSVFPVVWLSQLLQLSLQGKTIEPKLFFRGIVAKFGPTLLITYISAILLVAIGLGFLIPLLPSSWLAMHWPLFTSIARIFCIWLFVLLLYYSMFSSMAATLLDNVQWWKAFAVSWKSLWGRWLRVLGAIFVMLLIGMIVTVLVFFLCWKSTFMQALMNSIDWLAVLGISQANNLFNVLIGYGFMFVYGFISAHFLVVPLTMFFLLILINLKAVVESESVVKS